MYFSTIIIVLFVTNFNVNGEFVTYYMSTSCNANTGQTVGGRLETAPELTYPYLMDCWTTLSVASGKQIFLLFKRFDVEEKLSGSCVDYLIVYDGSSTSANILQSALCEPIIGDFNMTSTGSDVTFYFTTDESAVYRGFEVLFVAFTTPPCAADQFSCSNGILCIDISLKCDGIGQCGDNSDEAACSAEELAAQENVFPVGIVIGCVVAGLLLILITFVVIYKVYIYYYWKNWLKRNQGRKYPWEENDNDLYRYPKTDRYQVYEIGKKGRLQPNVSEYFTEEKRYYANSAYETTDEFTNYLDEK